MPTLIASAKAPIVYLNMPKSGCTSFKNWIHWLDYGSYLDAPMTIHSRQKELFLVYDADPSAFEKRLGDFTFTFVRHPLRRSYATFNDKMARSTSRYLKPAQSEFASRYNVEVGDERHLFGLIRRQPKRSVEWYRDTFVKFLHYVEDTRDGRAAFAYDWHWAEQTYVLANAREVRMPDFIGKLENTAEDFAIVAGHAGVSPDTLRRLNEGDRTAPPFESIVDDEIRDLGARIYASDLKQFGYEV